MMKLLFDKYKFSISDIYSVNETGITTVLKSHQKSLLYERKKRVGALVSDEGGVLVTAGTCMSAAGNFMTTMFIFARNREYPILIDDAPPGRFPQYRTSGWMQTESFESGFQRFIQFSKPSTDSLDFGRRCHPYEELRSYLHGPRKQCYFIVLGVTLFPHDAALDVTFMAPLSI
ncbi:hypothetical protein AVEN_168683-1 [Araneus ventricosus]|uniref:Uncharacterized protein n=1 Tax=Araneus ventricosus TaxID=182803 RepID=A0A4Y2M2Z5_ARAVE|nr:hypothetical protein AVEN_168683-1 [Araneus ventricosus]